MFKAATLKKNSLLFFLNFQLFNPLLENLKNIFNKKGIAPAKVYIKNLCIAAIRSGLTPSSMTNIITGNSLNSKKTKKEKNLPEKKERAKPSSKILTHKRFFFFCKIKEARKHTQRPRKKKMQVTPSLERALLTPSTSYTASKALLKANIKTWASLFNKLK